MRGISERKEDRPKGRSSANVAPLFLQGEDPKRAAGRYALEPLVAGEERVDATDAARYGDILHAVLLPRDRLSLDARPRLEVPELLAAIGVERLEFAGELACEDDPARCGEHAREARQLARRLPFGFAGQGIDRLQDAAMIVLRPFPEIRGEIDAEIELTNFELLRHGLVVGAHVEGIDEGAAALGIEGNRLPILAAPDRGPNLRLLAGERLLVDIRVPGLAGRDVDPVGPIHLHIGVRGEKLAGGAIDHIEETVAIGIQDYLGRFTLHIDVSKHHLGNAVVVEGIIGRELIVPLDLAGLWIKRENAVGIEILALSDAGVERSGIADSPIDSVQFRIERAGDPSGTAPELPGVARPRIVARFALTRDGVGSPEVLAGTGIPAVDEEARAVLRPGDASDDHAVGDEGRTGHRVAIFEVDGVLLPDFFAGFGVERHDVRIKRGAEHLAVIERGTAVDDAAAHDARHLGRIIDLRLPDLMPTLGIDRHGGAVRCDVNHAVVDERLRLLRAAVVVAVIPDRPQILHRVLADLRQRAIALEIVAHTVVEHVLRVARPLGKVCGGLRLR